MQSIASTQFKFLGKTITREDSEYVLYPVQCGSKKKQKDSAKEVLKYEEICSLDLLAMGVQSFITEEGTYPFHSIKNTAKTSPNLKSMMPVTCESSIVSPLLLSRMCQVKTDTTRALLLGNKFSTITITISPKTSCIGCTIIRSKFSPNGGSPIEKKGKKTTGKKEYHLWKSRDSAQSGQKALTLVRTVSRLPNEKEAVYGALDKWTAWETEFPLIAVAKALKILRKRCQWVRVIQVAKWMLSKGQGATMGTYDTLLLAFDMDQRVDEAESLWNMIIHAHMRSVSKRLFSRMISLYDHHNMPDKIIEVFADMEELQVKPDEDTVRRVARAFRKLGQEEKRKLVIKRYGIKWKYIHFNGERVRVRTEAWEDNESIN
ncbi:Pentatricopeptide repeat-containing protein, chloroplastic, partial [Mucuna pruriens]